MHLFERVEKQLQSLKLFEFFCSNPHWRSFHNPTDNIIYVKSNLLIYICKGLSVHISRGLFCPYTFAKGFSAHIHLQRACLPYTFATGFSAPIHFHRTFLPIYICKGLFCPYAFSKFFFCLYTFEKDVFAHIHLQQTFLPINISKGLFLPNTFAGLVCSYTQLACIAWVALSCCELHWSCGSDF